MKKFLIKIIQKQISKDNKIVEELTSTKHKQNVERKHRRELYRMLNEIVVKNKNDDFDTNQPNSLIDADELLNHINQSIVPKNGKKTIDNNNKTNHPDQQRTILLQKLDRMIKTIKEHHEQGEYDGDS